MKEKKKALAVVAGPYRFYQVLWLYTQFQEYEWSILILPYGEGDKNVSQIHAHCGQLGIFKNIYHSNMTGQNSSLIEQMSAILKMFCYYIIGRKKKLMKKILSEQTKGFEFDAAFVGCEYSIIEGAIIGLADEKEVYIFEEGLGDYVPKKKYPRFNFIEIASYFVCKMGYFSPYQYFALKNAKLCVKYASLPELITHRRYARIDPLFGKGGTRNEKYVKLVEQVYRVDKDMVLDSEVIFFTLPLKGYVKNEVLEEEKLHQWFLEHYSGRKILIKKHPRDESSYTWDDLKISFVNQEIPAELIVEYIMGQDIIMMGMCTTLLSLIYRTKNVYIIRHDNIFESYKEGMWKTVDILGVEENRIIDL